MMKLNRTIILAIAVLLPGGAVALAAPGDTLIGEVTEATSATEAASRSGWLANQAETRRIMDRAMQAYVFIGGGSGAVISPDGYIITNHHVISSSKAWRVKRADGKSFVADLVGTAPGTDLALLKVRRAPPMPFLPLGDSDKLSAGDRVFAIGNPFGLGAVDNTPTITMGVVSATGINQQRAGDAVVTDTPINPGNSGGPLINLDGELIGVNGQINSRFGLRANSGSGYAISSNQVKRYLDALKSAEGGQVRGGVIGGATFRTDRAGVVSVRTVSPDSQAAEAGLEPGDILARLGGWDVFSVSQLLALADRFPVGATTTLTVKRNGEPRQRTLEVAAPERVAIGVIFERSSKTSLKVDAIIPGSPAAEAGLQPGDVIFAVGRIRLPHRQGMQMLLARGRPGQRVPLIVVRDGERIGKVVELASISRLQQLLRDAQAGRTPATRPDTEDQTPADDPDLEGPEE